MIQFKRRAHYRCSADEMLMLKPLLADDVRRSERVASQKQFSRSSRGFTSLRATQLLLEQPELP